MKPAVPYRSASIEDHYNHALKMNDGNMGPHLPRLKALAEGLPLVVEFGVRRGGSSSALLLGAQKVISYDVKETAEARMLARVAGDRWDYHVQSSLEAPVQPCDLLFMDSLHTFHQCDGELKRHADVVSRWIVFHDSIWRGCIGEPHLDFRLLRTTFQDTKKREAMLGIRPAIDELMIRDRSWFIVAHHTDSCGLLVLERRPS